MCHMHSVLHKNDEKTNPVNIKELASVKHHIESVHSGGNNMGNVNLPKTSLKQELRLLFMYQERKDRKLHCSYLSTQESCSHF
ncbi:hypothetical protein POVCU2_0040460 [Plasmodium ovale curtisi]|uniref:Uncharacterized protein n=1 Tax=Plasmodium ovale curtisi TaxID=864141 RepID=A0A1A8W783_PLAOA|nr:hypothetical protein POVCU2_0040460 [Plasmodium ovale curtisi]SBS97326.1 hypothetical protein POVCU1_037300 [Plasmodium ovale curtisi]